MGMVVRTNTMALNAYRQLGMNNNAVSKSLEKLSSGFRINRAADDAAGLAISEKMKAQIKGLETASANAQDGISLLQTAEGNLSEVHNMLNRMVELATKSANGTYTITEREALQDEVDQLLSEIDRISQSANFNGAKLLDGSLDGEGKTIVKDATFKGEAVFGRYDDFAEGTVGKPQLHKDATGSTKTSFTVGFNDYTIKANENGKAVFQMAFGTSHPGDMSDVYASKKVTLEGEANTTFTDADVAKAFYDSLAESDHKIQLNYTTDQLDNWGEAPKGPAADTDKTVEYEVTLNADNTLTFTMTDAGVKQAAAITKENIEDLAPTRNNAFEANYTICIADSGSTGTRNFGMQDVKIGGADNGKKLAQTVVNLRDPDGNKGLFGDMTTVKDGSGIKVGDTYYVFATTNETAEGKFGDNVKIVDIRDLVGDDHKTLKGDNAAAQSESFRKVLARFTDAADDNKMFSTELGQDGEAIGFTEREDYNGNGKDGRADLTTEPGLKEQIKFFTGIEADVEKVGGKGAPLTLQIGDTADEYNKMSVNIADMSAKGLGINGLDITSEASASKAIDTIKTAINSVSSARAGMGALQNRLEYTINNLDVAVENLSAANSRIRDTDMAKEMMNYTKMNVLVQSAQAMLAQANQQPQSVLQLLQ